jgi:hypothetical protein
VNWPLETLIATSADSARVTRIPEVIPFRIDAGRMFQLMSSANQS